MITKAIVLAQTPRACVVFCDAGITRRAVISTSGILKGNIMDQQPKVAQSKSETAEHVSSRIATYSNLIGTFIINWSKLEHELNVAISNVINDGEHKVGHLIIDNLTAFKKIELFHRLYLDMEKTTSKSNAINLLSLKYKLMELNSFKNNIVHANWQTLSKKGFVKTKTRQNEDDGSMEFRNVLIKPVTIRTQIKDVKSVTTALIEYTANAQND